MKVLYITLDPPMDPDQVATGNQVRVQGIRDALELAGVEVIQATYTTEKSRVDSLGCFHYHTSDELRQFIKEQDPVLLIAGFWTILDHLYASDLPVVLDFIAPRVLELMYQEPETIPEHTDYIMRMVCKADHFLVGNRRQADLLLPYLLQAGIDCRERAPISVVPISARGKTPWKDAPGLPVRLVNAGVDWPWRDFSAYRLELDRLTGGNKNLAFVEFTGKYPGFSGSDAKSNLLSYTGMQEELQRSHIGLELGERNTEREFSHSFRALEYLECGLPVIINPWVQLSEAIRQYDAGWVIDSPAKLETLLGEILADPAVLERKRAGARELAGTALNYATTIAPLLDFIRAPRKSAHLFLYPEKIEVPGAEVESEPEATAEEAGLAVFFEEPVAVAPAQEESENPQETDGQAMEDQLPDEPVSPQEHPFTFKILLANLFKRYLCPPRPDSRPDILMVTRADLFPVDHGAAVKIIRTAEALSRLGRDVWLTTDNRKIYYQFTNGEMQTHRFPLWVRFFCLPSSVAYVKLIKQGFPWSNSFLYLPLTDMSYTVRTIYLASRKPVGAYQAEFPAYVKPCRNARALFGGKILLVQHNVEYERIRNQVPELTKKNYQSLKDVELEMCADSDRIVAVSTNDRDKMIADGVAPEKIHVVPHGVDLYAFQQATPMDIRKHYKIASQEKVLVYHGTYSYAPNLEAINVMATEILPRLEARGVNVTVLAIGSKPPDFPLHEKVIFAGSVADLSPVLPAADLAVIPLLEGGGTRMKILDYFAAGVPVISTAKGIEGIPVTNGREALILDDYDAICDAIESLLASPEKADKMRKAAARFVDPLSWDSIARRYLPLLH